MANQNKYGGFQTPTTGTNKPKPTYGGFQTPTTGTNKPKPAPPAWLSGGGAGAGGGQYKPGPMIPMSDEEIQTSMKNEIMGYQGFQTPTSSAPVGAVNLPGNNFSGQVGANGRGGVNPLPRSNPALPTRFNPVGAPTTQIEGAEPTFRPPAYGGVYNPTVNNPAMQIPEWMTNLGYTPPTPAEPVMPVPTYPASSTRPPGGYIYPPAEEVQAGNGGMATTYSGNWRRRRGGGGGGGYDGYGGGGGYGGGEPYQYPADMGLYSWKFG